MITARIQAHPARAHLHARLTQALQPLPTEVRLHHSHPPDPWAGYRGCLSDLPDCSHVLIVQDDALPVPNFVPALERIVDRHPVVPVCLYLGGSPSSAAAKARRLATRGKVRYIPLGPAAFMPLVAVLWPREKAESFLLWSLTARNMTKADDGNAARWVKTTRQQIMVTVPSLVQHDEGEPSVKGGGSQGAWCRAELLAEDALAYDW